MTASIWALVSVSALTTSSAVQSGHPFENADIARRDANLREQCGVVCVTALAVRYGTATSVEDVVARVPLETAERGTMAVSELEGLLANFGMKTARIRSNLSTVREALARGHSIIMPDDTLEHLFLVLGFEGDDLRVLDPPYRVATADPETLSIPYYVVVAPKSAEFAYEDIRHVRPLRSVVAGPLTAVSAVVLVLAAGGYVYSRRKHAA